jgi:hypothetical protein
MSTLRVWSMTRESLRNAYGQYGELRHLTSKIRTKTRKEQKHLVLANQGEEFSRRNAGRGRGSSHRRLLDHSRTCRKVIGVPGQRFAGSWEWRRLRQLAGPFDITEHPSATPNYAVATNAASFFRA